MNAISRDVTFAVFEKEDDSGIKFIIRSRTERERERERGDCVGKNLLLTIIKGEYKVVVSVY